jgi:cell division transport system permease protein
MIRRWLRMHWLDLCTTVRRAVAEPASTAMTMAVIGIAVAIPATLWLLVGNAERAIEAWRQQPRIVVYFDPALPDARAEELASAMLGRTEVAGVEFVSSEQGLEDFAASSGLGPALRLLEDNPLPAVAFVWATPAHSTPERLSALAASLSAAAEIDAAEFDMEWLRRIQALLRLLRRAVEVLAVLLAAGAALVVSNTVRMGIANRREEIEIIAHVGGSRRFIRRPFLYLGVLQGSAGAVVGLLLVTLVVVVLREPLRAMSDAWQVPLELTGMDAGFAVLTVAAAGALAWLASLLTVNVHLGRLEPV